MKFITNIVEAAVHGGTVATVVLLTLQDARFSDGRIFPIEALHFSIFFLLINVSVFRHLIHG